MTTKSDSAGTKSKSNPSSGQKKYKCPCKLIIGLLLFIIGIIIAGRVGYRLGFI